MGAFFSLSQQLDLELQFLKIVRLWYHIVIALNLYLGFCPWWFLPNQADVIPYISRAKLDWALSSFPADFKDFLLERNEK